MDLKYVSTSGADKYVLNVMDPKSARINFERVAVPNAMGPKYAFTKITNISV
jgi:hypothetical protein